MSSYFHFDILSVFSSHEIFDILPLCFPAPAQATPQAHQIKAVVRGLDASMTS